MFAVMNSSYYVPNSHGIVRIMLLGYFTSALHGNDFGSARCGLVYAAGQQSGHSPIK
jgi:hypothetical protein